MKAHLQGYRYLRSAIDLVLQSEALLSAITKEVYPTVARLHGSTPARVERSIRHAVMVSWESGTGLPTARALFRRPGSTKPTNAEFIATLADHLRAAPNEASQESGD